MSTRKVRRVMELVHEYGAANWALGAIKLDGTPETYEQWHAAKQRALDALSELIRHLPEQVRNTAVIDDEEDDR